MAEAPRFNLRNPAVKRIMQEIKEIKQDTSGDLLAEALETDIFEWHFVIRGPPDTEFEGGIYHGRILLPAEYPFKPPSFMMLTPNGRFETNMKICLSISSHHPEHWQPSWSVRTALTALIAFMPSPGAGALGALDFPKDERRVLAARSRLEPPRFGSADRQRIIDEMHARMVAIAAAKEAERRGAGDAGARVSGETGSALKGPEEQPSPPPQQQQQQREEGSGGLPRGSEDTGAAAVSASGKAEPVATYSFDESEPGSTTAAMAAPSGAASEDRNSKGADPWVSGTRPSVTATAASEPSSSRYPPLTQPPPPQQQQQQPQPKALQVGTLPQAGAADVSASGGGAAAAAAAARRPVVPNAAAAAAATQAQPVPAPHAAQRDVSATATATAAAAAAAAGGVTTTDHMLTALMWALYVGIGAILLRKVMGVIGFDISELLQ